MSRPFPSAPPDRVCWALDRVEMPELVNRAGFVRAAGNPNLFAAYPQVVGSGRAPHLFVTKRRYCWLYADHYLAFCYPDRGLLHTPERLLGEVRRLAPEFGVCRGSIRAVLTSLSANEYNRLLEYQRFEEQGRTIDPEQLRDFESREQVLPVEAVARERARCRRAGSTGREWSDGDLVIRPCPFEHVSTVIELQTHLNELLDQNYGRAMHRGLRELLAFDFSRPDADCLQRFATHGVMLEALWRGRAVAVGWFYRSFHAPRDQWQLWGRRCVVHPGHRGNGFGDRLWDGAVGLLAGADEPLRLRTLLHPRGRTSPALERRFRSAPPGSKYRSVFALVP